MANHDISLAIHPLEIVGVIGPNGAGKTTLFNLISGFHRPDRGEIYFKGQRTNQLRPDQISRLGIGRTFQRLLPFKNMTVLENVMVGALAHGCHLEAARQRAIEALEFVHLAEKRMANANTLSTGQRKRLEVARAMATRPQLLLLDEVTAGGDPRTVPQLVELMKRLRQEAQLTLLVIEHNVDVLMSICDRLVALHLGQKIAEGSPGEVSRHPTLKQIYFGNRYVED